jgi:hypothetical protein
MWRARPETLPESGRYDDREFERRDCLARPITHVPGRSGGALLGSLDRCESALECRKFAISINLSISVS